MKIINNLRFRLHSKDGHYENAERLNGFDNIKPTDIESGEKYLRLVHTAEYIEEVRSHCETGMEFDEETYTCTESFDAAIHSVGAAILASETEGFSLGRPPGHHAYPDMAKGFCLFNNIAIAAAKKVKENKRVLIVDFDAHCGDGTEKIFYDTDKVMYWSLHRDRFWPDIYATEDIGKGPGLGYTLNSPLPPACNDEIFWKAIEMYMPFAKKFSPDIVGVSAGFDGYQYDQMCMCRLTVGTYHKLGKMLSENFNNVFAVLEGGYNNRILPQCVHGFVDGINGNGMRILDESDTEVNEALEEEEANEKRKNRDPAALKNYIDRITQNYVRTVRPTEKKLKEIHGL